MGDFNHHHRKQPVNLLPEVIKGSVTEVHITKTEQTYIENSYHQLYPTFGTQGVQQDLLIVVVFQKTGWGGINNKESLSKRCNS